MHLPPLRIKIRIVSIFIGILLGVHSFEIQGKTLQLKVTTLNTEWLSCPDNGPQDDELQINNIASVISMMQPDIIVLQEVGTSNDYATIDTLLSKLGDEWSGSVNSNSDNNCGQNLGIIYRKLKIQLVGSSVLSSGMSSQGNSYYYNWSSGRYPVSYNVHVVDGNTRIPLTIVNLHAKAMSDETSYTRRKGASEGLKAILDGSTYNTKNLIMIGDFNDYLTGSQCYTCGDSPYKNFMDDMENYRGLTTGLMNPYYSNPVIDNIVISNELFENYVPNSAFQEVSATNTIANYRNTTSDHTPISALFNFQVEGTDPDSVSCENMAFSETFASDLGGFIPFSVNGMQTWYWRNIYGACISGYSGGINNENEDWLVSPVFNLSKMQLAVLSFDHALNFAQIETDKLANHTLWISTDYVEGNPNAATWTQLTIPVMPPGNNWTYVNSGNIDIPQQFMKENVRFTFKYLSSTTTAGTWEIKNLHFNATCTISAVAEMSFNSFAYGMNRQIKIKVNQLSPVSIYDIMGRNVFSGVVASDINIPVSRPGVYLVRTGNDNHKVVVK